MNHRTICALVFYKPPTEEGTEFKRFDRWGICEQRAYCSPSASSMEAVKKFIKNFKKIIASNPELKNTHTVIFYEEERAPFGSKRVNEQEPINIHDLG